MLVREWTRFVLLLSSNLGTSEYWAPTKTPFVALPEGGEEKKKIKEMNEKKEPSTYLSS